MRNVEFAMEPGKGAANPFSRSPAARVLDASANRVSSLIT
jgi:hypothetical protein